MTKEQAFAYLAENGVHKVEIHYYGGGDEGHIDEISLFDHNAQTVELPPDIYDESEELGSAFEQSVYDAVGIGFGDGEPDVDGYIYWLVLAKRITVEHSEPVWKTTKGNIYPINDFAIT